MCGVAGIFRFVAGTGASTDDVSAAFELLDQSIAYRGPDGRGHFSEMRAVEGGTLHVSLLHRRLAVLDPDGGHQPMELERGGSKIAIAFNGCVYNHKSLRTELEGAGSRFGSQNSDTETLLHGFAAWGQGVFERAEGMLASAIWESQSATLTLARDAFGEKTLFTLQSRDGTMLAFASVPRALLELARHPTFWQGREPIGPALTLAVASGGLPWDVPFGAVRQLAPGEILTVSQPVRGTSPLCIERSAGSAASLTTRAATDRKPVRAAEEIARLLTRAVQSKLESDVPLACLLSGGLDSSIVACLASRAPNLRSPSELHTVCVRMPDARYDESEHAALVAKHLETTHHTIDCGATASGTGAADDLQRLVTLLGFPIGDSSILPTYWACRAAREYGKVLLSGDGGDELFMGYERHAVIQRVRALQAVNSSLGGLPLAVAPTALLSRTHSKSVFSKLGRLLDASAAEGYHDLVSVFPSHLRSEVFESDSLGQQSADTCNRDPRSWELIHHLPDVLLRKTDHASLAAGVELRAPLLDKALAAFVLGLSDNELMPAGPKSLLRSVAARWFPQSFLNRPKMGFAIPIDDWFRTDFGGLGTLLRDSLTSTGPGSLFDRDTVGMQVRQEGVNRLLDEHFRAHGAIPHGQRLFGLLTLALWAKNRSIQRQSSGR
jgi:asparagine synthase (glutamine-hydrolysing)